MLVHKEFFLSLWHQQYLTFIYLFIFFLLPRNSLMIKLQVCNPKSMLWDEVRLHDVNKHQTFKCHSCEKWSDSWELLLSPSASPLQQSLLESRHAFQEQCCMTMKTSTGKEIITFRFIDQRHKWRCSSTILVRPALVLTRGLKRNIGFLI